MSAILIVVGLMIAGLLLIAIEVVVIPSFGLIGVLGGAAIVGSGYLAVTDLDPAHAGLAIAGGVIGAGVMLWFLPRSRAARSMVLETRTMGAAGDPKLAALLGRQGVALTPLRPAGTVEIGDQPVDVVSDGQYVETGTRVQVARVEGSRVVVEPLA